LQKTLWEIGGFHAEDCNKRCLVCQVYLCLGMLLILLGRGMGTPWGLIDSSTGFGLVCGRCCGRFRSANRGVPRFLKFRGFTPPDVVDSVGSVGMGTPLC